MEYVCHIFLATFTSLRIWGEKKNCSLLGALVFPLKIKTHKSQSNTIVLYCVKLHQCFLKYALLKIYDQVFQDSSVSETFIITSFKLDRSNFNLSYIAVQLPFEIFLLILHDREDSQNLCFGLWLPGGKRGRDKLGDWD